MLLTKSHATEWGRPGKRESFSKEAVHWAPFQEELCASLSHAAALRWSLKTAKEGRRLSASLDTACLELMPLPYNQKALRGEIGRCTLSVMCCRVNSGPSLKSFIKKKKKKINLPPQNCWVLVTVHIRRKKAAATAVIRGTLLWEPGVRLPSCVHQHLWVTQQPKINFVKLQHTWMPLSPFNFVS